MFCVLVKMATIINHVSAHIKKIWEMKLEIE